LIEPFRPGVMEKLGLGPEILTNTNPRLIFARLTGFGQTGAYHKMAGHDINYIAISGALSTFGRKDENPIFPVNVLGDFAGGGMLCAMGILLALVERQRSGLGQIVDAAMVEGAAYLSAFLFRGKNVGLIGTDRGTGILDSGAPFYETYKTKDSKFMAVGALEPKFYQTFISLLGLDASTLPDQRDVSQFPKLKQLFTESFAQKTRSEWAKIFDGTDACVTPVLELEETKHHAHTRDRRVTFTAADGALEPSPAPRLSRTPADPHALVPLPQVGEHSVDVLRSYGFSASEIEALLSLKSRL